MLCRHGESAESARGRCCGRLDVGLSARGRTQAAALAEGLAASPLAAVYSSPARRAIETGEIVAAAHGLQVIGDARLHELDFGELEGLRYDEIAQCDPAFYAAWMRDPLAVPAPGGETYDELRERVLRALDDLLERHRGETFAAVAHGGPLRVILARCLSMPDDALFRIDQCYGAINVVDWLDGTPLVRVVNADARAPLTLPAAHGGDGR